MPNSNLMKAAICTAYGPPEVLEIRQVPKPEPKADEILIRIHASAVNSGDVRTRGLVVGGFLKIIMRFVLGFNKPRKPILGVVLAGVVEKTGSQVASFKAGDEVFAMTGFKFSTFAEYICLNKKAVVSLKPRNASFAEAAAIIFGGTTALYFLRKAKIEEGENKRVLIYGASGSVGTSAIQIAKILHASVTAVCSAAGADLCKKLGADAIIDYTTQDLIKSDQQYDIIFDAVGKIKKNTVKHLLSSNGKFVTVEGLDVASESNEMLDTLRAWYEEGKLNAVIDRSYTLDEMVEAHRYVDSGRKKGNVVIQI